MRTLLLDDGLAPSLAVEVARRGRPCLHASDLGLQGAEDRQIAARARADDLVLVTVQPIDGDATIAVVPARDDAARREVVHRFAHAMAAQRPGTVRRYPR